MRHLNDIKFITLAILKYTSQWFLVFSQSCMIFTTNKTFLSFQNVTLHLLAVTHHSFFPPKPLARTNVLPVSVNFLILYISYLLYTSNGAYNRKLFVSGFIHLVYAFKDHSSCTKYQYFIPFYDGIWFHYIDKQHPVYPFISWWKFELFPHFGDCE